MSVPCPCCDITKSHAGPVLALAMGVGLGAAFPDIHRVTELMCAAHRAPYVMAMMHAQVAMNTAEDGSTPSSMFDEVLSETATEPSSVEKEEP